MTPVLLTEKEKQVLAMLTTGKGNKQIAAELFVCDKTVEFHLGNIYTKIGRRTRVAAAVWAIQNSFGHEN